jgi:hypothetical protein
MRTSALLPLCNTSASCDINRSNLGISTVSCDITTGQCADQRCIKQLTVPPLLFLPHSQKCFFVQNSSYMVCMWTEASVCAPKIEAPCIYVASCVFEKQKQKIWWYLERLSFPIKYADFQLWTWNREKLRLCCRWHVQTDKGRRLWDLKQVTSSKNCVKYLRCVPKTWGRWLHVVAGVCEKTLLTLICVLEWLSSSKNIESKRMIIQKQNSQILGSN